MTTAPVCATIPREILCLTQNTTIVCIENEYHTMIITLEGLDGAGKTTLSQELVALLPGYTLVHYPTPDINLIPKIPKDAAYALDMLANPLDPRKNWVVDRYYHSHMAYGGKYGDFLQAKLPAPDYTFLIDLTAQESLERCKKRGDDLDITLEMREKIRYRYWQLGLITISGHLPPKTIAKSILDTIVDPVIISLKRVEKT